jgi:hypothetical protein
VTDVRDSNHPGSIQDALRNLGSSVEIAVDPE